jgi:hypothetical protein
MWTLLVCVCGINDTGHTCDEYMVLLVKSGMTCNAGGHDACCRWSVDFWGLWCWSVAEVGCISYAVVMVAGDKSCGWVAKVVGEGASLAEVEVGWRWGGAASGLVVGPTTALVGEGCQWYNAILSALRAPCCCAVFKPRHVGRSSHDGLLFLPKPLYLLLDPDQFIILHRGIVFFCFVLVLDTDLVELSITLDDLRRRRHPRGRLVLVTSASL